LRKRRVILGKDQLVPLFQPAVKRRIREDQILAGVMAGALRALVNLPLAIEDCRKGRLAAAGHREATVLIVMSLTNVFNGAFNTKFGFVSLHRSPQAVREFPAFH